jgi:hypothetical protein
MWTLPTLPPTKVLTAHGRWPMATPAGRPARWPPAAWPPGLLAAGRRPPAAWPPGSLAAGRARFADGHPGRARARGPRQRRGREQNFL